MENTPLEQFNSVPTKFPSNAPVIFLEKTLSDISSLSSDPLFSTVVTFYTLVLLYFPGFFLRIFFSPVLISTGILLLTLIRLGEIQRIEKEVDDSTAEDRNKWVSLESNSEPKFEVGLGNELEWKEPLFAGSFAEWNVRAPLEVIYEEYEGKEEEEDDRNDNVPRDKEDGRVSSVEKYPSLSLYYPETDSDGSSDGDFAGVGGWDSLESACFRWDDEDQEGLIEIALDGKRTNYEFFHIEEDNLIEIDISPERTPAKISGLRSEKQ
ncbi:hypothetical protein U1Q18_010763 [Sarracenia purpurea var. burkii]